MRWRPLQAVVLALTLCGAASADVSLLTVVNNVETAAVSAFNYGNVAQGDTKTVRFRMRNYYVAAAIQVTILGVSGPGFALNGQPPIPFVLAPGAAQDFNVIFTAGSAAGYSGNLQVNTVSVTLLASASPAPALTALPPCTGTTATVGAAFFATINFGRIPAGQLQVCDFQLANQAGSAEAVSIFTLVNTSTGSGFLLPPGLTAPLLLAAQQSTNFSINFSISQPGTYSGTLTIASRIYQLTATVFAPPLPAPILSFDTTLVNSGEQHTLSMRLPAASSIDASGNIVLVFVPDSPVVSNDPAVVFVATGTRTLPFSVKANTTQVLIGGASGAVFQTGTSSGKISFTVSGVAQGLTGSPTTQLRIPAAIIAVDSATLTARPGNLDIQVTGFDNTYTAGTMAFTFYDSAGNAIDPGTIHADFTPQFHTYFSASTTGSAFLIGVTFPVSGNELGIAAASVALTNAAGTATIGKLAVLSTLTID